MPRLNLVLRESVLDNSGPDLISEQNVRQKRLAGRQSELLLVLSVICQFSLKSFYSMPMLMTRLILIIGMGFSSTPGVRVPSLSLAQVNIYLHFT